mgnify:CR=1 FL=1
MKLEHQEALIKVPIIFQTNLSLHVFIWVIILSDINVFKEITEDQGVYFDPKDIWSIGEKIRKVTEDPNLSSRLIEYGRKRVKEFDFKNLAPKLLDIYLSQ